ncbi:MAG: Ig-like domain-containing protein, partial [Gemmatimonas sp.]
MRRFAARLCRRLSLVSAAAALAGCGGSNGDSPTGQPPVAAVATVTIAAPTTSVNVGESLQLAATLSDQSGKVLSGRTVDWTTSNANVASINGTGLVTGIGAGSATITATSESKSGTAVITVAPRAPRDFAIVGAQFTQGVQDA